MERKQRSLERASWEKEDNFRRFPSPADFMEFLPWACNQFQMEKEIVIVKVNQNEYISTLNLKTTKATKRSDTRLSDQKIERNPKGSQKNSLSDSIQDPPKYDDVIKLTAIYSGDKLVEIRFEKYYSALPRLLLKVIVLIIKFYRNLYKITIKSGRDKSTLYELRNILSLSNISDICLDGTFLADYHILLEIPSHLRHLSLSRCNIEDQTVQIIASKLVDPQPASKTLAVLNLSSNKITDVGAKYLAGALRLNMQLNYLNLAGNQVSDNGFLELLFVLSEFIITSAEKKQMRQQLVKYVKQKITLTNQFLLELRLAEKGTKRRSVRSAPGKTMAFDPVLQQKAEQMATDLLGKFKHPFNLENTVFKYNQLFCRGNNTLCYLNMAYNSLTYDSLPKLVKVLEYQDRQNRKPKGLVAFSIEGNPLPRHCVEFSILDNFFEKDGKKNLAKKRIYK